jgi:putative DNA primase/helicase
VTEGANALGLTFDLEENLPGEPRRLTAVGNSQRFVDQQHMDLRYVHVWRRWLWWNGRCFQADKTGEVLRRAKEVVAGIYGEAAAEENPDRRKAIAAWAARSESEGQLREMLHLAACEMHVLPEQLDADPWRLTVENGTVNLRTGVRTPHSRNDLSTKLAPVAYDDGAQCPTWIRFLERILGGDQELIAYLQRAIGYSLTGETSEQVLFFLYGTGSNGKTTLLELLRDLLGEYAQQADFSTFLERRSEGPRNDIARLQGARLVAAIEAGEGHRLAEGLVKQLTGGDTVAARFLYAEHFEFRPQFKVWLAANHKPVIKGTDHAIWRRIRLIPFTVTIPEDKRDRDLPAKLRAELPGILRWAVEGCLAWQRQGLGTPPAVREATESYREDMDDLGAFLSERCLQGPGERIGATALFEAYRSWAAAGGLHPMTQKRFGAKLGERQLVRVKTNAGIVWHGVTLVHHVNGREPFSGNLSRAGAGKESYGEMVHDGAHGAPDEYELREREALQAGGSAA